MTRNALIDRCKALIKEAYEEATEMVVAYLELHPGEQLKPLCREIDPENWVALDSRVRRARERRTSAGDEASAARAETERKRKSHAKSVLRHSSPEQIAEIVADLDPAAQRKLAAAVDNESAKRQKTREQDAKRKEREHLGDETVDDLEQREELQSTEYLLITARGNLRGFVKHVGEIGVDNTPDAWRESCLDWIDDLEGHLGMAKALLAGDNIDWAAFDDLLQKEGR